MSSTDATAKLTLPDGRSVELPWLTDSAGNHHVDIRALYGETGVCAFDPGFSSTASCRSAITLIDGNKGLLLYRGPVPSSLIKEGPVCL